MAGESSSLVVSTRGGALMPISADIRRTIRCDVSPAGVAERAIHQSFNEDVTASDTRQAKPASQMPPSSQSTHGVVKCLRTGVPSGVSATARAALSVMPAKCSGLGIEAWIGITTAHPKANSAHTNHQSQARVAGRPFLTRYVNSSTNKA